MRKYFLLLFVFLFLHAQAEVDITNLAGGIVTSQYNDSPSGEVTDKLIDNSSATKYLTFNASAWVQYQSPAAYVVGRYTITSGNDAPERDPKNWELTGSNNGVTFYPIDSRINQVFSSRGLKKEFSITNNTKAYLYYRLQMTNNSGTILQLAEIEFFGIEGALPTTPFADFSVDPALYSGTKVTFTNASLNTTSYSWTFEGGTPATSIETSPNVSYDSPGTYAVTLVAYNGTTTSTKSTSVVVKDITDWSTFIYPTVTMTCSNTGNAGYLKYNALVVHKGYNTIEDFVRNCCLIIAKQLYYTVDEANAHNLRAINYKLTEGGSLSYKAGSVPNIEIGFDMNYLNTFSQSHSDATSADEIYGVLCHEICHGYQREPKNAGVYGTPSEYYGFIEGTADLARLLTGGFNPVRYPRIGGSWLDAYNTTAFFYYWIRNTKSATFLKDLNKTALTIDPWTLTAATQQLFGVSAQALWNQYQAYIPAMGVNSPKVNDIFFFINQSRTELVVNLISAGCTINVINVNGIELISRKTNASTEKIDISKFPNGIYLINVNDSTGLKTMKFVK